MEAQYQYEGGGIGRDPNLGARRPSNFVEIDPKTGRELGDFGKGIDAHKEVKEDDEKTQDILANLFGNDAAKFNDVKPESMTVDGKPIDNHKITITNVKPSVRVSNTPRTGK